MKKILFSLLLLVSANMMAKDTDDSKYLAGAVPEQNGQICFQKSFRVPGKSAQEIYQVLNPWVNNLVDNSIQAPGNYARIMGSCQDSIVARVCEWMVFKKKALNLDRARFRYQMKVNIEEGRVTITVNTLYYYYGEDMEGNNGQLIKAEDWISDKEALNKTQTKLYPKSNKFRRKTVDRMEELFNSAMDAFEEPEQKPAEPVKPTRHSVVED